MRCVPQLCLVSVVMRLPRSGALTLAVHFSARGREEQIHKSVPSRQRRVKRLVNRR